MDEPHSRAGAGDGGGDIDADVDGSSRGAAARFVAVPRSLLNRLIFCNPVCFLVTANAEGGGFNAMTVSWLTPVDNHAAFVLSLNFRRHSLANLRERPVFSLSPVTPATAALALAVGAASGAAAARGGGGKAAAAGLRLCAPGHGALPGYDAIDAAGGGGGGGGGAGDGGGAPRPGKRRAPPPRVAAVAGAPAHLVARVVRPLLGEWPPGDAQPSGGGGEGGADGDGGDGGDADGDEGEPRREAGGAGAGESGAGAGGAGSGAGAGAGASGGVSGVDGAGTGGGAGAGAGAGAPPAAAPPPPPRPRRPFPPRVDGSGGRGHVLLLCEALDGAADARWWADGKTLAPPAGDALLAFAGSQTLVRVGGPLAPPPPRPPPPAGGE